MPGAQMPEWARWRKARAFSAKGWAIIVGFADIILRPKELKHGIR